MMHVDIAIIGGGIAGLSCAAYVADDASVAVLEMEPTFGYHATGRSAALYTECYGSAVIRRLAQASRPFLTEGDQPLMTRRGVLFTSPTGDTASIDRLMDDFLPFVPTIERLTPAETESMCPLFPASMVAGGVYEHDAADIDVDALQTRFIRIAREAGATTLNNARTTAITRISDGWHIVAGEYELTATTIVNAAGAWGDHIAGMAGVAPIGLRPLARSVFTFDPGQDPQAWPMVLDANEQWYIKPEGQHMIGSAASEIPAEPGDIRAEELDVALGIENVNNASTLAIRSVKNTWAGLRTFTPDRAPAVGFAPDDERFFWLVGQGGYGIKTSPAIGAYAASQLKHREVPDFLRDAEVPLDALDPARFALSSA